MKKTLYKYRLLITGLSIAMLVLALAGRQIARAADNSDVPPTQVIISQAVVVDQGVELSWIEAQPGTYPLAGYIIKKANPTGEFTQVAAVKDSSHSYVDVSGQAGDSYQVIAEDNQSPPNDSLPSDTFLAVEQRPGDQVVVISPEAAPAVDSLTNQLPASPDKVDSLQSAAGVVVNKLGAAADRNQATKVQSLLITLHGYNQQVLTTLSQLPLSKKQSLAQSCQEQAINLEPILHILPEANLIDGLLAQASCQAIQNSAT